MDDKKNNNKERPNDQKKKEGLGNKAKKKVIDYFDENGNGAIDIEDIIIKTFRNPANIIDRDKFLRAELMTKYDENTINKAIETRPALAGIDPNIISEIADDVINKERLLVTGKSIGLAAVPTIPGSIVAGCVDAKEYFSTVAKVCQKLLYLYGFPKLEFDENNLLINSKTSSAMIGLYGVMFEVNVAEKLIKVIALKEINEQKLKQSITKVISKILPKFTKAINKYIVKFINKKVINGTIYIVGTIATALASYKGFTNGCKKIKATLEDTYLSNPNYNMSKEVSDFINADFEDVVVKSLLHDIA